MTAIGKTVTHGFQGKGALRETPVLVSGQRDQGEKRAQEPLL